MKQKLLIEGKDDLYTIAELVKKRKLPIIKGTETPKYRIRDFFEVAEGKTSLIDMIPVIINIPDLTNFGIIIDADEDKPQDILRSIGKKLEQAGYQNFPQKTSNKGLIFEQVNMPKIGVWIMPDNINEGYLEYFLADMTNKKDAIFELASETTQKLIEQERNNFSELHKPKADIHTYLAWQKKPGLPFGTAISNNTFNVKSPLANLFVDWFQEIFELENN